MPPLTAPAGSSTSQARIMSTPCATTAVCAEDPACTADQPENSPPSCATDISTAVQHPNALLRQCGNIVLALPYTGSRQGAGSRSHTCYTITLPQYYIVLLQEAGGAQGREQEAGTTTQG